MTKCGDPIKKEISVICNKPFLYLRDVKLKGISLRREVAEIHNWREISVAA